MLKALAGLIPWADILKAAPQILSTANDMLDSISKTRAEPPEPPHFEENHSVEESIRLYRNETIKNRRYISELQEDSRRHAMIIERIAEHDQQVSKLLEAVRIRLILALGLSGVSLLGVIICLIFLFIR
ncbi:MAG: hypothetical protein WCU00_05680 [Candidatus Latescibacterota bacterium]